MDDKHTIKVGEPGYPVAGVERGRQLLVTAAKKMVVADHDFTKFSMTPSVLYTSKSGRVVLLWESICRDERKCF